MVEYVIHERYGWGRIVRRGDTWVDVLFFDATNKRPRKLVAGAVEKASGLMLVLAGLNGPQPEPKTKAKDKRRVCKKCCAIVLSGRCPCASVRLRRIPAKEGSLDAASAYQIIKSIRSGSWAKTGYKSPYNVGKIAQRRVYEEFGGVFTILGKHHVYRSKATHNACLFFLYRCETAYYYRRDELYGLMATRLTLWAAGETQQRTCDFLQIPRTELLWLDKEIRKYVNFPWRPDRVSPELMELKRKVKAGVAQAVIRRAKHGYKQNQVLRRQVVST